jgi:hypothetical protein
LTDNSNQYAGELTIDVHLSVITMPAAVAFVKPRGKTSDNVTSKQNVSDPLTN